MWSLLIFNETPIKCIDETGIQTSDRHYDLDLIIYATGFDAITGSFTRMDIRGRGGQSLTKKWANGPRTYLGLQTVGFPNMFTIVGPHNAATFCNIPRCIEQNVDWVTDLLLFAREKGRTRIEATPKAEAEWTEHVHEMVNLTLIPETDSWFMGVNSNLPNKKRTFLGYAGGAPRYREKCDEVAANGYEGFEMA